VSLELPGFLEKAEIQKAEDFSLQTTRCGGTLAQFFPLSQARTRLLGYTEQRHGDVISHRAKHYLRKAGIKVLRPGSHTLRHTCVQHLLDAHVSLKTEHTTFEPVGLPDCTGEVHEFQFRIKLFGTGVVLDAFEFFCQALVIVRTSSAANNSLSLVPVGRIIGMCNGLSTYTFCPFVSKAWTRAAVCIAAGHLLRFRTSSLVPAIKH
jgi:hypothetical protein